MGKRDELIVGLDIGTTKIAAVVGEIVDGRLDIIGIGTHPSKGLRKGVVVNIDETVSSIKHAIEEAEHMAGCQITSVYAGISGGHIKSQNSHGIVAIKDREVKDLDITRVIDAAKAIALPLDREVIHVLPQDFIVDEQDGIREPLGMAGVRLEARVHIVTAAVSSIQNILKCANRCGLHVADVVLEPLASSLSVIHEDERELGVALVDIGGGTTDVALFVEGSIVHTSVIPLGGNHITSDLAFGLRTPLVEAEKIKIKHGCAVTSHVKEGESFDVPSVGGRAPRMVERRLLAEIVEARAEEIFRLVQREIAKSGHEDALASGVVITGGSTVIEGITEIAEQTLGMPVRRGQPHNVGGLLDVVRNPMYATGVGLVLHGAKNMDLAHFQPRDSSRISRVKSWFRELF